MSDVLVCPSCGARLEAGATACDLCGQPLEPPAQAPMAEPDPLAVSRGGDGAGPDPQGGVFCHACGWKNPAGARFCSRCGTALQADAGHTTLTTASTPSVRPATEATAALAPRLLLYIAGAILLVGGLFLATIASRRAGEPAASFSPQAQAAPGVGGESAAGGTPSGSGAAFAPLSETSERQVQALEAEVEALTGEARSAKQTELTNLLIGLGRPDRAAEVAVAAAEAAPTPEAWRRAADLLYRWMEALPDAQRGTVAPRVVAAYDRVLAARADDLDARTNLGWAAQYDATGNPMRAILETNEVLRRDSVHLGATYNRGWFLRAIGRLDQAITQFEKVKRLAGPETPLGREAQMMIEGVRRQQNGETAPSPGAAPAPASPPVP